MNKDRSAARSALALLVVLATALIPVMTSAAPAAAAACGTPAKVTLSSTSVVATTPVSGTVRLACRPGRAIKVALIGGAGLVVPASVTVDKGRLSAGFRVRTLPSTVTRHPWVTARANGVKRSVMLTVRTGCASRIAKLTVPSGIYAGETRAGSLTLGCAPRSAVAVTFSSSDPALTVPTVIVPAGRTTVAVRASVSLASGDRRTAQITARYAGARYLRSTTITPGLKLVEIPASSGFNDVGLNIVLTGTAPDEGLTVKLASNSPAVTVPSTYVFTSPGAGGGVPGISVSPVSVDTPVTLSVTLGNRTITVGTTLLRPYADGDAAFVGTQAEGIVYGTRTFMQFDLNLSRPAPAPGVEVTWAIRGAHPALTIEDFPTQTVTEGQRTTSVSISAADVTATTVAHIDVTIGSRTVSRTVTIEPRLLSITAPSNVVGGSPFSGTITMAGPSTTDQVIYLQSSWGIVTPDDFVTIPAGQTSVSYGATSVSVDEDSPVFLTAFRDSESVQTELITLTPVIP